MYLAHVKCSITSDGVVSLNKDVAHSEDYKIMCGDLKFSRLNLTAKNSISNDHRQFPLNPVENKNY